MKPAKIVSGGQSGADRAALDWAIEHQIPHGGWCPKNRWAEDGPIDPRYRLQETDSAEPIQRTEWNVRDSEGTVIFSISPELTGGSRRTFEFARKLSKPLLHVSREKPVAELATLLRAFMDIHNIRVLNIAGPRSSQEPEIASFVREVLDVAFA